MLLKILTLVVAVVPVVEGLVLRNGGGDESFGHELRD